MPGVSSEGRRGGTDVLICLRITADICFWGDIALVADVFA